MSVTDWAIDVIAVYFGINLFLAVAWWIKSCSDRRERNRRDMQRFLDQEYANAKQRSDSCS